MFGRKKSAREPGVINGTENSNGIARQSSDDTLTNNSRAGAVGDAAYYGGPTKQQIKRATRTRFIWTLIASFLLLLSIIFLILVEIGQTDASDGVMNSIYFINIDLSNIIPVSVPDATLINSIAQTLGLHDFYRVGLWGFCEGYNGQGVTDCSKPQTLYWFNPVEVITSELLAGATIALPAEITTILSLIRTVSHWMFGLFLTGACLSFVMIFLQPLSVFSRWAALPVMIFTFLSALFITVATVIATVLFIIFSNVITSATQLNINAHIGVKMFAFMWIAAGASILAWLIQLCLTCCCASRRDIKKGKKTGSKKAWNGAEGPVPPLNEKEASHKRGLFGRKK